MPGIGMEGGRRRQTKGGVLLRGGGFPSGGGVVYVGIGVSAVGGFVLRTVGIGGVDAYAGEFAVACTYVRNDAAGKGGIGGTFHGDGGDAEDVLAIDASCGREVGLSVGAGSQRQHRQERDVYKCCFHFNIGFMWH